jgi:hypothetical protein
MRKPGRSARQLSLAVLLLLVAVSLTGCGGNTSNRVVMVLLDRQTVAPDGTLLPQYQADYQRVVDRLASDGGLLFTDIIDANPLGEANALIRADFPTYDDLSGNKTQYTRQIRQARSQALDGATQALSQPPTAPGIDLLNAMRLAERVFANYPSRAKTLVVFSSMFQQTADVDFLLGDPAMYEQTLVNQASPASFPDLRQVRIFIAGAGVAPPGAAGTDAPRILAVQNFWSAWMKRAGTEIPPGHYATQLIAFT